MSIICEVSSSKTGFSSELSYGSHFFQDLVEAGIFYVAINDGQNDVIFNPEYVLNKGNKLTSNLSQSMVISNVIHVSEMNDMEIFSDVVSQTVLCR